VAFIFVVSAAFQAFPYMIITLSGFSITLIIITLESAIPILK